MQEAVHTGMTTCVRPISILRFWISEGFDSSRILILRVGIPRPIGNFPEQLSQGILAGITLVGRSGVRAQRCSDARREDASMPEHNHSDDHFTILSICCIFRCSVYFFRISIYSLGFSGNFQIRLKS